MTVGGQIKKARKKAGLKQSELAEKLGVAVVTIGQYERNQRQPRYDQLQRIAAALGTTVSNLLPPDNYWEDEDGVGHTEPAQPEVVVHDEPIQAPKVVVHDDPPEELEALLAKLQDGEPLVLSPEELAKLKGTPKEQVAAALDKKERKEVKIFRTLRAPVYKMAATISPEQAEQLKAMADQAERAMGQTGRVARFNHKFSIKDPQIRIAAALDQLNAEGREKAAERVEELTEIPRYRAQDAPQDTPPAPGGTDTTPATDAPQRPQEPPTGPSVIVLTMVCPLCARKITGNPVTKTAYCPNCKKSFPLPQK